MPALSQEISALERYGHNLTALARQGAFAPLAGYDAVIDRAFQILLRKNKNNPLILSPDESRRWKIVAEIVRRMAVDEAPEPLRGRQIIALDYEALFANLPDDTIRLKHWEQRRRLAGQAMSEELERVDPDSEEAWDLLGKMFRWPDLEEWEAPTTPLERLQEMFVEMRRSTDSFLLFADHFHRLVGGECDKYPIDAVALLKPTLARRQIQLIGACTLEQYKSYVEQDAAIQRRIGEIVVPNKVSNVEDICQGRGQTDRPHP